MEVEGMAARDDRQRRERASNEAAEMSKAARVAHVYLMPNGKYIATTSGRDMVPGRLVQTFVDGAYS